MDLAEQRRRQMQMLQAREMQLRERELMSQRMTQMQMQRAIGAQQYSQPYNPGYGQRTVGGYMPPPPYPYPQQQPQGYVPPPQYAPQQQPQGYMPPEYTPGPGGKMLYMNQYLISPQPFLGPMLRSNEMMMMDQYLRSGNGRVVATLNRAGSLVLQVDGRPVWESGGHGGPGPDYRLVMQQDGNLVIYRDCPPNGHGKGAVWASGSSSRGGSVLAAVDEGNLIVYEGGTNKVDWAALKDGKCTVM